MAIHDNTIIITIFTTTSHAVEEMVARWDDSIGQLSGGRHQISVVDISMKPAEAERHDIVFSPTTLIVFPNGRQIRLTGYSDAVPSLIRAYQMRQEISALTRQNESMLAFLAAMKSGMVDPSADMPKWWGDDPDHQTLGANL